MRVMLGFAGELPDLGGARFEAVIQRLADQFRPAPGQAWDRWEHRAADALVEFATNYEQVEVEGPTLAPRPLLVVEVPERGPATVAGIPLPDAMVEALRAQATIEAVLVDDTGVSVARGRGGSALSAKIARAVLLRDGHCRWPGCERRHGLQVDHLVPRSWGGSDGLANLAAVCAGGVDCHGLLAPTDPGCSPATPTNPTGSRGCRSPSGEPANPAPDHKPPDSAPPPRRKRTLTTEQQHVDAVRGRVSRLPRAATSG